MRRVVVTGLGVVSSIGTDVAAFTAALRAGRSGIASAAGRPVAAVGDFDLAANLDGCPDLAAGTRRAALKVGHRSPLPLRAAVAAAVQAHQHARLHDRPVPGDRVGLVVGGHNLTGAYAYEQHDTYEREPAYLPARYALRIQDTDHVGSISEALSITGEGYTVGASSATGNAALIHAARMVGCDAADVCLAVGAMTRLAPPDRAALAKLRVLSDGVLRPLDAERDGFVPGEASACLVLEEESVARRRGADILARIGGTAQTLDGNSLADPSVDGETRAMRTALARAGRTAPDVDYVNAHATATPAGDDAELSALRRVLGNARPWVNATKALVGHCLTAAGTIEALATVVQMRDGFVHPNPGLVHPVDAKYRLVGEQAMPATIRTALSNGFGFGGINTSVVLLDR